MNNTNRMYILLSLVKKSKKYPSKLIGLLNRLILTKGITLILISNINKSKKNTRKKILVKMNWFL